MKTALWRNTTRLWKTRLVSISQLFASGARSGNNKVRLSISMTTKLWFYHAELLPVPIHFIVLLILDAQLITSKENPDPLISKVRWNVQAWTCASNFRATVYCLSKFTIRVTFHLWLSGHLSFCIPPLQHESKFLSIINLRGITLTCCSYHSFPDPHPRWCWTAQLCFPQSIHCIGDSLEIAQHCRRGAGCQYRLYHLQKQCNLQAVASHPGKMMSHSLVSRCLPWPEGGNTILIAASESCNLQPKLVDTASFINSPYK